MYILLRNYEGFLDTLPSTVHVALNTERHTMAAELAIAINTEGHTMAAAMVCPSVLIAACDFCIGLG